MQFRTGIAYPYSLIKGNDGNFYGLADGDSNNFGTVFQMTPEGVVTILHEFTDGDSPIGALMQASDGTFYGTTMMPMRASRTRFSIWPSAESTRSSSRARRRCRTMCTTSTSLSSVNYFGYYSYLSDPHYIYHFDLGYEYVFDAADANAGVIFLRLRQQHVLLHVADVRVPVPLRLHAEHGALLLPDPSNQGRYNTNGARYFYDFATGKIITK